VRRAEVYGAHAHEAGGQWGQVVAARGRGTQAIAASPAQDSRGVGVLVEELLQMQRSRSGRDELQQTDVPVPCSRGLGTALAEEPRVSVNEHVVAPGTVGSVYHSATVQGPAGEKRRNSTIAPSIAVAHCASRALGSNQPRGRPRPMGLGNAAKTNAKPLQGTI
jgi:hypothetical protein